MLAALLFLFCKGKKKKKIRLGLNSSRILIFFKSNLSVYKGISEISHWRTNLSAKTRRSWICLQESTVPLLAASVSFGLSL